jgi:hypothetical protein
MAGTETNNGRPAPVLALYIRTDLTKFKPDTLLFYLYKRLLGTNGDERQRRYY